LRKDGQRLAGSGRSREKNRAVLAVARKLAELLLSLWKHGTNYEPQVTSSTLVITPVNYKTEHMPETNVQATGHRQRELLP